MVWEGLLISCVIWLLTGSYTAREAVKPCFREEVEEGGSISGEREVIWISIKAWYFWCKRGGIYCWSILVFVTHMTLRWKFVCDGFIRAKCAKIYSCRTFEGSLDARLYLRDANCWVAFAHSTTSYTPIGHIFILCPLFSSFSSCFWFTGEFEG